jgi:hypothetical protein
MTVSRIALSITLLLLLTFPAPAMISVLKGNSPVQDHNWPANALDLANLPDRVAMWEGPPMGGGQTQFVYRGDTGALQKALDLFAKINAPNLRLNLYESPYTISFLDDQPVDFTFTVWDPLNFHMLYNNPSNTFFSRDPSGRYRGTVDPPTFDVYLPAPGAPGLDWSKIKVPSTLNVNDHRATAHGYTREDESVIAGRLYDMLTSKPIPNARITVTARKTGDTLENIGQATTDDTGRFEIKKLPPGYTVLTISADNFATRVVADTLPPHAFLPMTLELTTTAPLSGTLKDTTGKAIANATIRPGTILGPDGR